MVTVQKTRKAVVLKHTLQSAHRLYERECSMPPSVLAVMLAILGPRMAEMPTELQLKEKDQILFMTDYDTIGQNMGDVLQVLSSQYPRLGIDANNETASTAAEMAQQFAKSVERTKPTIILLSMGTTEARETLGRPIKPKALEAHVQNMSKLITNAQAAGIKVIVLGPTLLNEDPKSEGNRRIAMYVAAQKKLATEKKCRFLDLNAIYLRALAKRPNDVQGPWLVDPQLLSMTRSGFAMDADCILRELGVPDEKIAGTRGIP